MSKKDLLERLTRAPTDPMRPRREEEVAPGRPVLDATKQSRVNTRVVRRRRVESEEPPPPTVARRRAVALTDDEPAVRRASQEPAAERPDPEPNGVGEPSAPHDAPASAAPVHEPEPARPALDERPTEVDNHVDARERDGNRQPEPAADEPRHEPEVSAEPAAAPEPERAPEPVRAADPEPEPEPAPAPTPVPTPTRQEPRSAPAHDNARAPMAARPAEPAGAAAAGGEAAPGGRNPAPRFRGLGPAVIVPPPGYDPTNPDAYLKKLQAERQAAEINRRTPTRRRVDTPVAAERTTPDFGAARQPADAAGARRRGGRSAGPSRMLERPVRRKGRGKPSGPKTSSPAPKAQKRKIKVDNQISVGQLAHELGVKAPVVIRQLMELGMMASITQMLDPDTAALVATEFEYEVENVGFQEHNYLENVPEAAEEENEKSRPPVVTIMGHVDHGKTTLLDAIRTSRVAQGEAGGITQHIGAYQVDTERGRITFIDTPGHAAFTAMRARGAQVTDIVVLVVAADDGVQPQTLEAINHARAAKVPIVVAVNKMDKAGVSPEPIMTRLAEQELVPEQWGGDTMYVPVSALKGEGIDALLESLLLQAEVLDLKANPDRFAEGVVLEAKMERGRGAVATVLVQKGTLKRGDHVVLGSAYGKVRAIVDSHGESMKEAGPSTAVELFGLSELPEVGDSVHAVKSEQNARALAEHRANTKRETAIASTHRPTREDLFAQASATDRESMLLILKADVGGSLQALKSAIEAINVPGAQVRILYAGVGDITESDVNSAAADGAQILGFNVKLDAKARQAASQLGVNAELYSVIYDVLDRITRGLKGLLAPVYEQVRVGTVEVRQLFKISKVGTVAGSYVLDGKIARNNIAKVLRNGSQVWEGKVHSIRRFKDDVREVTAGHECGVSLDGFELLEAGDLIEAYAEQIVEPA